MWCFCRLMLSSKANRYIYNISNINIYIATLPVLELVVVQLVLVHDLLGNRLDVLLYVGLGVLQQLFRGDLDRSRGLVLDLARSQGDLVVLDLLTHFSFNLIIIIFNYLLL